MPNNQLIIRNTLMLYIRMAITMIVSLYTSRVILEALGVVDYGIYNVVGGVVAMFGFLRTALGGATQRFLSYEIGLGESGNKKGVFSTSLFIYICIAILAFIFVETIGVWFLNNKLIIPSNKLYAANWVLQFSIFTMIMSIISAPYNALIIAHERMNIYAYISIIEVLIKLVLILILKFYISEDKLIAYGFMLFFVSIIVQTIYMIYCLAYFEESHVKCKVDKKTYKRIMSFASLDLLGCFSIIGRSQGVNILLNMFFGPVVNAAHAISMQVQGVIMQFGANITTAIKPQIIKSHAIGDDDNMFMLIVNGSKYCYLLTWFVTLPILIEIPYLLKIWLKEFPDYTIVFCRLTLLFNLFDYTYILTACGLHALCRIKQLSIINGLIYLLVIPISYIAFRYSSSPAIPYIANIIILLICCIMNMTYLKHYLPSFPIKTFIFKTATMLIFISVLSFGIVSLLQPIKEDGFIKLLLTSLVSVIVNLILIYTLGLNNKEREYIKIKVKEKWTGLRFQ